MRVFSAETTHFTAVSKKGSSRVCLAGRSTDSYAKNSKKTASGTRVMAVLFIFLNAKANEAGGGCGALQALGFQGEGTLRRVDVFMRTYYLHASRISRLTSLIIHRSVESARSLFSGKYTFGRNLRDGIRIFKGQISVTKPDILKTNPGNL